MKTNTTQIKQALLHSEMFCVNRHIFSKKTCQIQKLFVTL